MNCADIEKLLLESLDSADRPDVRAHLFACAKCGELRRQLEEIEELNRALARTAGAPRGFSGKVASEVSRKRRIRPVWGVLWTAMAGLALLGTGLHWSDGLSTSAREVAERIGGQPEQVAAGQGGIDFSPALQTHRQARHSGFSYSEVVIAQPSGASTIIRIPSTIQIRRTGAVDGQVTKVSY